MTKQLADPETFKQAVDAAFTFRPSPAWAQMIAEVSSQYDIPGPTAGQLRDSTLRPFGIDLDPEGARSGSVAITRLARYMVWYSCVLDVGGNEMMDHKLRAQGETELRECMAALATITRAVGHGFGIAVRGSNGVGDGRRWIRVQSSGIPASVLRTPVPFAQTA